MKSEIRTSKAERPNAEIRISRAFPSSFLNRLQNGFNFLYRGIREIPNIHIVSFRVFRVFRGSLQFGIDQAGLGLRRSDFFRPSAC